MIGQLKGWSMLVDLMLCLKYQIPLNKLLLEANGKQGQPMDLKVTRLYVSLKNHRKKMFIGEQ